MEETSQAVAETAQVAEEKPKTQKKSTSWRDSKYKWKYLKVALLYFTTPTKVYEIAHKVRGSSMRDRIIRGRLVEMGVLSRESSHLKSDIDLENGHL